MFADTLNHPSANTFQDRALPPGDAATRDELPALLRQSLLMWERIFAWQEDAQGRHPRTASPDASTTVADQP